MFSWCVILSIPMGLCLLNLINSAEGQPVGDVGLPMPASIEYSSEWRLPSEEFAGDFIVETSGKIDFNIPSPSFTGFYTSLFEISGKIHYTYRLPTRCLAENASLTGFFELRSSMASISKNTSPDLPSILRPHLRVLPSNPIFAQVRCKKIMHDQDETVLLWPPTVALYASELESLDVVDGFKRTMATTLLGEPLTQAGEPHRHTQIGELPLHTGEAQRSSVVKLHLACKMPASGPNTVPLVKTTPNADQSWPLDIDHSKTASEINLLKNPPTPGYLGAGLTIAGGPNIYFNIEGSNALHGEGVCIWMPSIGVDFPAVNMFINKKYANGSCEYKATLQHELKHYKVFVDIGPLYQEYFKEMLENNLHVPTLVRPTYAKA